ncbi:SirB2 family protein [Rhodoferax sp. PAMC 29310]|uniref:SirB2 family protein n=1 Tax=Rhodoferax sp. PAMC 29310 TaxID=2822760 RepID=UPI001B325DC0|nr:SirB2 family protein [Rhodoferax sp. PAMC 29310]
MDYYAVKTLHISCMVLSITLFVVRGGSALSGYPWRRWGVLRWAPHLVDTVLLSSALWLAWQLGQYPFADAWLTAKVLALLAYIGLGARALGKRTPAGQRPWFYLSALFSVGYIVAVALTHSASWGLWD